MINPKPRRIAAFVCILSSSVMAQESAAPKVSADPPKAPVPVTPPTPPPPPTLGPQAPAAVDLSRFVKFDGQIRTRYEFFKPFSYSATGVNQSDDAVFLRTRLGATFSLHRNVSARFQFQDSRIWGEEGANTGTNPVGSATASIDNVDIHQAYVDLGNLFEDSFGEGALSFRLGRQELSFGDQRLVSPLDWSNVARAWDAARVIIDPPNAPGGLRVDIFASIIRDTASSNVGGGPVGVTEVDQKQGFHGIYAAFEDIRPAKDWTWTSSDGKSQAVLGKQQVDLYTFYRDLADGGFTSEDGSTGDVDEFTLGARVAGEIFRDSTGAGFDYTGEFVYQTGTFSEDDISAFGYAVTSGYTFAGGSLGSWKLRPGIEWDYGSGDSDPTDGDRGTFDPLFPFGHNYQGIQDTFSWKNGQDLSFNLRINPPKETKIIEAEAQYHFFWLSEDKDGWFNASLAQIRRDTSGSSGNFVGSEVDVLLKYALVPPFAVIWAGYSHFFPGDFVDDTGKDPGRDFIFAQLAVTF